MEHKRKVNLFLEIVTIITILVLVSMVFSLVQENKQKDKIIQEKIIEIQNIKDAIALEREKESQSVREKELQNIKDTIRNQPFQLAE